MQDLIETIRTAVVSGATSEQKASGVAACRAILTALDTEPGRPLTMPGMEQPASTPIASLARSVSSMSVDQMLDLMIARLTTIANTRETSQPTQSAKTALPAVAANPDSSRGLRVPLAARATKVTPHATLNSRRPSSKP